MFKDILVPVIVLFLATAFLDPFMILMPESISYVFILLLFVAFVIYAALIQREKAADEREEMHRSFAGRVAYITGSAILVTGIIYQAYFIHQVDSFLIVALVSMIVAKYLGILYAEKVS